MPARGGRKGPLAQPEGRVYCTVLYCNPWGRGQGQAAELELGPSFCKGLVEARSGQMQMRWSSGRCAPAHGELIWGEGEPSPAVGRGSEKAWS